MTERSRLRPRNWDDVRRRVLDEDYLTPDELERQRELTGSLKHVIWFAPLPLLVLAVLAITGDVALLETVPLVLISGAAILIGLDTARQERRWGQLIREKSGLANNAGPSVATLGIGFHRAIPASAPPRSGESRSTVTAATSSFRSRTGGGKHRETLGSARWMGETGGY
jgi:hypothetical protein